MAKLAKRNKSNTNTITRDNIDNPNCKYQTIASTDEHYITYVVMHEYDTILEARSKYQSDIDTWKKEHDTYHHFGIKEIKKENVE